VRRSEIATGDTIFSPFVAAGWHIAEEENVRPAQWLGLLKILGIWGAEFYYAGFFSLSKPFPIPENWVWQAAIPSYAQAVTSQYADLFFDSDVLDGDLYSAYTLEPPGNCLWAGAGNRIAMARKHRTKDVYVVSVTVQRYSNIKNSSMLSANVSVRLPNTEILLEVEARRQGSTYVLDNNHMAAVSPRLVQLDGFHEATHPYFWSPHTDVEAEMFQGFLRDGKLHPAIITETNEDPGHGNLNPYSFLGFTSFVRMSCGSANSGQVFSYTVEVPPCAHAELKSAGSTQSAFIWVRARALTTGDRSAMLRAYVGAYRPSSALAFDVPMDLELRATKEWTWRRFEVDLSGEEWLERVSKRAPFVVTLGCSVGEVAVLDVDRLVLTFDAYHDPGRT
jgi:hypothetical protein